MCKIYVFKVWKMSTAVHRTPSKISLPPPLSGHPSMQGADPPPLNAFRFVVLHYQTIIPINWSQTTDFLVQLITINLVTLPRTLWPKPKLKNWVLKVVLQNRTWDLPHQGLLTAQPQRAPKKPQHLCNKIKSDKNEIITG